MRQRVEMPQGPPLAVRELLSAREREVVRDIMQGLTNREIAARLGISEKMVKTHLRNVFRKLHIRRRVDLLCTLLTTPATIGFFGETEKFWALVRSPWALERP